MAKYLNVSEWILSQIKEQDLKENDKIPTEMQISQILGVSRQTVRKAIEHLVEQDILCSIRGSGTYIKTGYGKPRAATNSKNIAVVTTFIDSYIFPEKTNGIYEALYAEGYMMNLFATHNSAEKESALLSSLYREDFAGMILEPSRSTLPRVNPELFTRINDKFPIVLIDSHYHDVELPYVALDDTEGGYIAVSHLLENGHQNIMHIGKMDDRQGLFRYQGYLKALHEFQVEYREENVIWYTNEEKLDVFFELHRERILKCLTECTAVFCYNDAISIPFIEFLEQNRLRIPADVSVVGYDNSPLLPQSFPLTTIVYPGKALGKKAVEVLMDLIQNRTHHESCLLQPALIKRDSVKNISTPEMRRQNRELQNGRKYGC